MATQLGILMANRRPRIVINQATHVQRTLIGVGEILVSQGSEVAPQDIIGHSNQSSGYTSIKLAKQLGVSPKDAAQYLQKRLNTTIFKGELLATKHGWFGEKKILAPTDGTLEKYDSTTGELRLRFLIKQAPLTAGVYGIVDQVNREKGEIWIRTMATVIYGMVGFGFQRGGILEILGDSSSPIQSAQITPSMGQHILVAGALMFKDAIKKAAGLGILGVVTGGINIADYRAMVGSLDLSKRLENDVGITVLATEGFGPLPLGQDVSGLLKQFQGKFVFINGNAHRIILPNFKPEGITNLRKVSLPLPKSSENTPEALLGELEIGRIIRFVSPPLMGMQGVVVGIDNSPTMLESGISTYMVTVETAHQKVKIPFPNIEIIS